ncbi:MAG: hypothetical protein DWH79_08215 [Planctomycetota bacterium]|nr:MAG: hypothetical protein DWH79_08215 [Planctomycetota bacterium]
MDGVRSGRQFIDSLLEAGVTICLDARKSLEARLVSYRVAELPSTAPDRWLPLAILLGAL